MIHGDATVDVVCPRSMKNLFVLILNYLESVASLSRHDT